MSVKEEATAQELLANEVIHSSRSTKGSKLLGFEEVLDAVMWVTTSKNPVDPIVIHLARDIDAKAVANLRYRLKNYIVEGLEKIKTPMFYSTFEFEVTESAVVVYQRKISADSESEQAPEDAQ